MPNHYRSPFSQTRKSAGKPPADARGEAGSRHAPMRTASWPSPGPTGSAFSKARKGTPTVKQYVTSKGLA